MPILALDVQDPWQCRKKGDLFVLIEKKTPGDQGSGRPAAVERGALSLLDMIRSQHRINGDHGAPGIIPKAMAQPLNVEDKIAAVE